MAASDGVQKYHVGDWTLQNGQVLKGAEVAYKTWGSPSSPAIIYPSWFSGMIADNEWLIGPDKALNPSKYFIVVVAMFGNGQSTSPSNTSQRPFPDCTMYDNVRAQHKLATEHLGITHAHAVLGWSMGAGQTFQWVTQFPDFVDLAIPFCGSAKTALHNNVFLESLKSALLAPKHGYTAGACNGASLVDGDSMSWTAKERDVGLRAFGRIYAGWGFSQAFYRQKLFESAMGFKDLEDFIVNYWEKWALSKDPGNLMAMLYTWQAGDCSNQSPYNGDFRAAMQGIKAKVLVMPCQTDLYFPPEDSYIEVENMKEGLGQLAIIPSVWGHFAGGPGDNPEDVKWIDDKLRAFGV